MPATLTYQGRLPGVVVQAGLPAAADDALRLDVAAFVGFAERGPLNTPVALEDFRQFQDVFGGSLLVARDKGRPVYAHLAQAVRAYFDNGGQRCYVVRVAGKDARPNRFRIPGLVGAAAGASPTADWQWVTAEAAWAGRWSDGLSIGTQLKSAPLRVSAYRQTETQAEVDLEIPQFNLLRVGDLLRLRFDDAARTLVYLPVGEVRRRGPAAAATRGIPVTVIAQSTSQVQLATRLAGDAIPALSALEILGEAGWQALAAMPGDETPKLFQVASGARSAFALLLGPNQDVRAGEILRLTAAGGRRGLFCVETAGLQLDLSATPPDVHWTMSTTEILWESEAGALPLIPMQAELLRFDLRVRELQADGVSLAETWQDVTFGTPPVTASQPAASVQPPVVPQPQPTNQAGVYWADVLACNTCDPLMGVPYTEAARAGSGLQAWPLGQDPERPAPRQGRSLRLRAPDAALASPPLYLPLGMAAVFQNDLFTGPLPEAAAPGGAKPPGKDGLDSFDPQALFLDEHIGSAGARDLGVEAEQILYLNQPPLIASDPPQRLQKLHSLFAIDEVAIIAMPDAAQRGWVFNGPPGESEPAEPPPPWPVQNPPDGFYNCPLPKRVVKAFYAFIQAADEEAARALLTAELNAALPGQLKRKVLGISCSLGQIDSFTVKVRAPYYLGEAAYVPAIVTPAEGLDGSEGPFVQWFTLTARGAGWAIACISRQPTPAPPPPDIAQRVAQMSELIPVEAYPVDGLLAVQAALINLCAARADCLAVLNLPGHFATRDALDWQASLLAWPGMLDGSPLSYAAVYHPWLVVQEDTTPQLAPTRTVPPDGAVCGMIAARSLARGAWIAPANVALAGVVDLSPELNRADWADLFNGQFNLVRHLPGRFTLLSAHTLSQDPHTVQVSVRRLLIFLRKIALLRGTQYVFESNNALFRQRVQAGFERLMQRLLARGALTAYQVETGSGLNTQNDSDNGRFLVALKVAPTIPIEFITVVLLRRGENYLQVVEM